MSLRRSILIISVSLIISFSLFAQVDYRMKTLTTEHGLPSNEIYKTFQQKNGFIWIASDQGVSRYDGKSFKHYQYSPGQKNHISNNQVKDILEDRNSNIWISTESGLNKISPDGTITIFQTDQNAENYLPEIWLISLFEDRDGTIWLGTGSNLKRYDPIANKFETYLLSDTSISGREPSIYAIAQVENGHIYLATSAGVSIVNIEEKNFSLLNTINQQYHHKDNPYSLLALPNNKLVIGTEKSGVLLYDLVDHSTVKLTYSNDNQGLAANDVSSLMLDNNGDLWIGHTNDGISIYSLEQQVITHIKADEFSDFALKSNMIRDIYIDHSGLYWIATGLGLSIYSPLKAASRVYRYRYDKTQLSNNYVYDIIEQDNYVWLATGEGLNRLTPSTQEITHFPLIGTNGKRYKDQAIWQLASAPNGKIWLGGDTGLRLFDPQTRLSQHFEQHPQLPQNPYYTLQPMQNGSLWITGYIDVGLTLFNLEQGVTKRYFHQLDSAYRAGGNYSNAKVYSSQGEVWLASTDGLFRANPATNQTAHYKLGEAGSGIRATSIIEGEDHSFWVTTAGEGLLKVTPNATDINDITVERFFSQPMANANELRSVAIDKVNKKLWLVSKNQLMTMDLITGHWQSFPSLLDDNKITFFENAILQRGNVLYLGSANGLIEVDTTLLRNNEFNAPLQITKVRSTGGDLLTHLDSRFAPKVSIPYQENDIEIAFAALDFTKPKQNQYHFKLEGTDHDWRTITANETIRYNNLASGNHTLMVRGTNSDGVWSSEQASFEIEVTRPWWFYAIIILTSLLLLVIVIFLLNRRRYIQFLHDKAHIDTLTGLANRFYFNSLLNQQVNKHQPFALMMLDLDYFKEVNDTYGHYVGDLLLIEASKRMSECVGNDDIIGRLGGDEFALIIPSPLQLEELAEQLRHSLSKKFYLNGHVVAISCSIGVSQFPIDANNNSLLLSTADAALYAAKENGRDCIYIFNKKLQSALNRNLQIRTNLHYALANKEMHLMYQPKVNQFTNKIVGVEALLRWHNATLGEVEPSEFISQAESNGTITDIGYWVIKSACQQAQLWHQLHSKAIKVAINISSIQLIQLGFIKQVQEILIETEVCPSLIEFEITETVIIDNYHHCISVLSALREMGITIAIDDFGVGYSSFNYLARLPLDTLKIDQSFVQTVTNNSANFKVLKHIYSLANDLGLEVVAEGVENREQLTKLATLNGAIIQGNYYSKAISDKAMTQMVQQEKLSNEPQDKTLI